MTRTSTGIRGVAVAALGSVRRSWRPTAARAHARARISTRILVLAALGVLALVGSAGAALQALPPAPR